MNPRTQVTNRQATASHRGAAQAGGSQERPPLDLSALTPLHFVLGGLVLLSAGQLHRVIPVLAVFRPGVLLVVVAVAMAFIYPRALRFENLTKAWPGVSVIALALVWTGSSLFGLSFTTSAAFVLQALLPIFVGFTLMLACMRNVNDVIFIVAAYVASMFIVVLASVFIADAVHLGGYTRRGGVGMYDGNDIGVLYLVGIPLALTLVRSGDRWLRVLGWAGTVGMPLSLVLTASRGGFLGLLSGGLALVVLTPGYSAIRKFTVVAVAAGAMVMLAPSGYWGQMATMLNPQDDYNVTAETGRLQIWRNGLGYIQEYPVFGLGPNNFVRAGWELTVAGRTGLTGVARRDQAPHNTFLQVWAELGTVGLLVWLGILAGGVISCLNLRRRMPRWWLSKGTERQRLLYLLTSHLPACFIGFAATTFFVSHAYTQILYILLAILGGTLLAGRKAVRESPPSGFARVGTVNEAPAAGPRGDRGAGERFSAPPGGGIPLPRALRSSSG